MAADDPQPILGLIAGQGAFPLDVARAARRAGRRVVCVALKDRAEPAIADEVEQMVWIHPGEVTAGIAAFRQAGVSDVVMAGKVPKAELIGDAGNLRLDATASELLGQLPDRRDDTILAKAADVLEMLGIHVLPQWALVPELLAGPGPLGAVEPTAAQRADIAFGWPIALEMGRLDIGQTVVVKDRAVLAVEAIEGTDAAIRRAGTQAPGGCVVKRAKPQQDPRFDCPAIGWKTVEAAVEARVGAIAFEAGKTIVLEREALAREADAHGIAVVGVAPGGLEEDAS
jgi:DUF1009 family protein